MVDDRTRRVAEAAVEAGADWALLTAPDAVCYATGYEVPIETGPSPFQGGPALALVARDGECFLLVTDDEYGGDGEHVYAHHVQTYTGFSATRQLSLPDLYVCALGEAIGAAGAHGSIAWDYAAVPLLVADACRAHFDAFADISPWLSRARAVKTQTEMLQLRYCAELAAAGQRAAVPATKGGLTEIAAFAAIRLAMEGAHGARMPMTGDYISGVDRTAACEGWPSGRVMVDHDPVICDLSPRAAGYWGDSCNTLVIGDPTAGFLELYEVALRAIHQAAESVRPGISAGTLANEVAAVIEASGYDNPLHVGHGIGTGFHEFPRIVVEETAMLESGMVLMIEPGAYRPGVGGARLEWMFEVTATGNRVLTDFPFTLSD